MPVRSLNSSVLTWPDRDTVVGALRRWADQARGRRSDLDVVILLRATELPFERRSPAWDATGLPVPADVLVYTDEEWDALHAEGRSITRETVWL